MSISKHSAQNVYSKSTESVVTSSKKSQESVSWIRYNPLFPKEKCDTRNKNLNIITGNGIAGKTKTFSKRKNEQNGSMKIEKKLNKESVSWIKFNPLGKIVKAKQTKSDFSIKSSSLHGNRISNCCKKHAPSKKYINFTKVKNPNYVNIRHKGALFKMVHNPLKCEHSKVISSSDEKSVPKENSKDYKSILHTEIIPNLITQIRTTRKIQELKTNNVFRQLRSLNTHSQTNDRFKTNHVLKGSTSEKDNCVQIKTEIYIEDRFIKCGIKKIHFSLHVVNYYIFSGNYKAQCKLCNAVIRFKKGLTIFLSQHLRHKHCKIFGLPELPETKHFWIKIDNGILSCVCGNTLNLNKKMYLWKRFVSFCCNVVVCVLCCKVVICENGSLENAELHWRFSHYVIRYKEMKDIMTNGFLKAYRTFFSSETIPPFNLTALIKPRYTKHRYRLKYVNKFFSRQFCTAARCKLCGAICTYMDRNILHLVYHLRSSHSIETYVTKYDLLIKISKGENNDCLNSTKLPDSYENLNTRLIFYCTNAGYKEIIDQRRSHLFFIEKFHEIARRGIFNTNLTKDKPQKDELTQAKQAQPQMKPQNPRKNTSNNGDTKMISIHHYITNYGFHRAVCEICRNCRFYWRYNVDNVRHHMKCVHYDDLHYVYNNMDITAIDDYRHFKKLNVLCSMSFNEILSNILNDPKRIQQYMSCVNKKIENNDGSITVPVEIKDLDLVEAYIVVLNYLISKRWLIWKTFSDLDFPQAKCKLCGNENIYYEKDVLHFLIHVKFGHEYWLLNNNTPLSMSHINLIIMYESGCRSIDISNVISIDDIILRQYNIVNNEQLQDDRQRLNSNLTELESSEEIDELYNEEYVNERPKVEANNIGINAVDVCDDYEPPDDELDELYSGEFTNEIPREEEMDAIDAWKISDNVDISTALPMKECVSEIPSTIQIPAIHHFEGYQCENIKKWIKCNVCLQLLLVKKDNKELNQKFKEHVIDKHIDDTLMINLLFSED